MGSVKNGTEIRRGWDGFCPEGTAGFSPGFQPPGTVPPRRRAPKGRKIERENNI